VWVIRDESYLPKRRDAVIRKTICGLLIVVGVGAFVFFGRDAMRLNREGKPVPQQTWAVVGGAIVLNTVAMWMLIRTPSNVTRARKQAVERRAAEAQSRHASSAASRLEQMGE
jgi:hypothetical protein